MPFDLEAVFSSAFILILTTIAYPSIQIDPKCIVIADTILNWMCSNKNLHAISQKQDLDELRTLANIVNSTNNHVALVDQIASQTSDWLWNALDIDTGRPNTDPNTPMINLMSDNVMDLGLSDELLEQQWFWDTDAHLSNDVLGSR
jgi:preprotein translocase subunit Sec63